MLVKKIEIDYYQYQNKKGSISGRVSDIRDHNKIIFANLIVRGTIIQMVLKSQFTENFEIVSKKIRYFNCCRINFFISKTEKNVVSLFVTRYINQTSSNVLRVSKINDLKIQNYRRDSVLRALTRPSWWKIIFRRSKTITLIRRYFEDLNFLEFDTPTITREFGGANSDPFVTVHNSTKKKYFLSVSPELDLKKLLAAGFEKIYTICKDFRNQKIDPTHYPEFLALEFYSQGANYITTARLAEDLIKKIINTYYPSFREFIVEPWQIIKFKDFIKDNSGIELTAENILVKYDFLFNTQDLLEYWTCCANEKHHRGLEFLFLKVFDYLLKEKNKTFLFVKDFPSISTPLAIYNRDGTVKQIELYFKDLELSNIYTENNQYQDLKLFEQDQYLGPQFLELIRRYSFNNAGGCGIGLDRLFSLLERKQLQDILFYKEI